MTRRPSGEIVFPVLRQARGFSEEQRLLLREGLRSAEAVASVPDSVMRAHRLADRLVTMTAQEAAWLLEGLIRGALHRSAVCLKAYDALLEPQILLERIEADTIDDWLDAAVDEGCPSAEVWLRSERPAVTDDAALELAREEQRVAAALRELTLGARRALARRASGDTIGMLLIDPDPGVVLNLLRNPRLNEAMVLRLVAHRPTPSGALEAVLQVERWRQRYRLRLALARNPYLRIGAGVKLLPTFLPKDLRELWLDENLATALRVAAKQLLDVVSLEDRTEPR